MRKHSEGRRERADESTAMSFAVLGVALAAVACCGLPALLAALGAGALGGVLGQVIGLGWPLALLIAAFAAITVYTVYRTVKARRTFRGRDTGR